MSIGIGSEDWLEIDPWWETYVTTYSPVRIDREVLILDRRWDESLVSSLDPWWTEFERDQERHLRKLRGLFHELDRLWEESRSQINTDPLAVDWQSSVPMHGPLRPNVEENWSQWLGHLLRSSTILVQSAFGVDVDSLPHRVHREEILSNPSGHNRRPDILAQYNGIGVHIEVKIDDINYRKVAHTARLVERYYPDLHWHHLLLIPGRNDWILDTTFDEDELAIEDEWLTIRIDEHPMVRVSYWEDVGKAIRLLLLENGFSGDHLRSSAFVFCTLIEQKILRYILRPSIETTSVIWYLSSGGDIDQQLSYLREFVKESSNDT